MTRKKQSSRHTIEKLLRQIEKNNAATLTSSELRSITAWIDTQVYLVRSEGNSVHERLFDVLMRRIDVLQRHRKAFLSIIDKLRKHPHLLATQACMLRTAMRRAATHAKTTHPTVPQSAIITALQAIYAYGLYVWQYDSSADLSKTMAAFDRALRYADRVAGFFITTSDK